LRYDLPESAEDRANGLTPDEQKIIDDFMKAYHKNDGEKK
jgi:hypothetical protein